MPKIGIRDVAKLAGVSTGTVSRVLNDHPSVTDELRVRVRGIIEQLGYMPDPSARSMRSKVSRLIGIVIPDLTNPFFSELVQSAEQAAARHRYNIIVMTSFDHADKEADRIGQLTSRKVDGIILVPSNDFHTLKLPKGLPIVIVDRLLPGYSGIAADHRSGVRLGVEHLVKLGHRRIGFISGPKDSIPANDRLKGYLDAMEGAGELTGGKQNAVPLIAEAAFDYESGRSAGNYLLARARHERPTAIFASSDQQAIGCMRAAHDLGIPIPAALSIVGFDGIPLASMTIPRLTTVKQPIQEIAAAAVAVLLSREGITGKPLLLSCEISEGETTSSPQPD
jgi:LacI family transcriptional regulator